VASLREEMVHAREFYHGTAASLREKIQTEGLKPGVQQWMGRAPAVYLSGNETTAFDYAMRNTVDAEPPC
jgi:RNA:NAD 2'-phosphotransferase (TPT1/KptA family)